MQSKNKIQTRPIEDFIGQVRTAKNSQQKQIVLPMRQAEKLADSLAQTMTRLAGIQEEIIEALKTAQESQTVNIEMDGGGAILFSNLVACSFRKLHYAYCLRGRRIQNYKIGMRAWFTRTCDVSCLVNLYLLINTIFSTFVRL